MGTIEILFKNVEFKLLSFASPAKYDKAASLSCSGFFGTAPPAHQVLWCHSFFIPQLSDVRRLNAYLSDVSKMLVYLFALLALAKSVSPGAFFVPPNCYTDERVFDCSAQSLEFAPPIPPQVESAALNDNQIRSIDPNLPPALQDLDLSNNALNHLELNSASLFSLKVSGNPLLTLKLNLSGLVVLNASSCSISFLPPGFFELLPLLEVLDLSGNEKFRAIPPNHLQQLYIQRTYIRSLPAMPNLVSLDVSNNFQLLNLQTGDTLKKLKAANCSLIGVILNRGLLYADLSSNQIVSLHIHEDLEYLDASNNSLNTLDIANARLTTANLADNKLTDLRVSSRYLNKIDLSRNPMIELSVHCSQCHVDCSFCQIRKVDMTNVKSLNLQYNNIQKIVIEGVKEVDLRYNLLTEINLVADTFDLRHNSLADPSKVDIRGTGFLADNPWICQCEGLRQLRDRSKDQHLLCGGQTFESCFSGPRKTSHSAWVTLLVAVVLLVVFMLVLYFIRLTSKEPTSVPQQDASECEEVYRNDALPTYEEALRMSKPEWRQGRNSSRRCRPD
ncbi:hypothetical protein GE061_003314 [Apolygus lucorum]|uniref:LRRCT domain-containing protein n=1 Tax=Apolygus lucorum TaxID=248454 RepID=A0A6A4J4N6_APOLU|nr:hypothetical protein GE061_003314 [Apolygus lucorum]